MSESLVSGSWHRVEQLRPSLVPGLRIVRQQVRDQVWHVLVEPASGRQLRLNPGAWDLVGRFDGRATLGALWLRVLRLRHDEAPTQDEVLALLAQLFRGGLVQFDAAPHLSLLFARRAEEGAQRRQGFVNPLLVKLRLGDPTRWLQRLTPVAHVVFSVPALVVWLLVVAVAVLVAATEWTGLRSHAASLLGRPSAYAMAWVLYPLVKAVHELGHALAVRRWGGDVREVGVSLMFLTPAPYVDAGAASAFPSAVQRLAVSAAGIAVELALASLALFLWVIASPGWVRDAAMSVALICSVSTLLFNGNPLMRLDGYHVLCDALSLPNLAARSQAWWVRQWMRLTGETVDAGPLLARGERKWLVAYAPLSWAYRVSLLAALVMWVGQHAWLAGWLAAACLAGWLVWSLWKGLGNAGVRARRIGVGAVALVAIALFVVPAPQNVVTQAVVWAPNGAQLRAPVAGFVQEVAAADGSAASPGATMLQLQDPALEAARARLAAEQEGLLAQQYVALLSDPVTAQRLAADIERNRAEVARADEQLAAMQVRAQAAGRVAWVRPVDLPGSFAQRGALLGYVIEPGPMRLRLALAEDDFTRVRGRVHEVEVRLVESPEAAHSARLLPAVPGATQELASAALGEKAGGPVPLDPAGKDGLRARAPVFMLDVSVSDLTPTRIGARAWVKLVLPPEPLAQQAARRASQLFVKQFNPTGQL